MQDNQFHDHNTVTLGEWMLTLFITFIPIVNIIMFVVWAFSGSTKRSKSNWAKAMLLWAVIFIVLGFSLGVLGIGAAFLGSQYAG